MLTLKEGDLYESESLVSATMSALMDSEVV
jgi:hypothetical protein